MNAMKRLFLVPMLLCTTFPALAVDPVKTGALPVAANNIVGTWATDGAVGPCGSGVTPIPIRGYLQFQAGGTVLELPRFPPDGVPNAFGVAGNNQRSYGVGTWSYNPLTHQYTMKFHFDWFVDNVYHGYNIVERTLLLSNDRKAIAGPARATRYAANGTVLSAVCGSAVSTRL